MSFINKVVSMLQPKQPSAIRVVNVTSLDFSELPNGFFRVRTLSGKESLGYNCLSFLSWDVGETVVDAGKRITLSVPRAELPIVNLSFSRQQQGVQQIGGCSIIDTEALDGDSGAVVWAGSRLRDGVDYV
jgi:hypothetical protein